MRFPRTSRINDILKTLTGSATLALVAVLVGGCDGLSPRSFDPNKGFIDPSEVAVIDKASTKRSLMVPILEKLDPSVEQNDSVFINASDVKAEDLIAATSDYTMGRSDLVQISITDLVAPGVETIKAARVSESGNISLPLIGQVQCEGLTEAMLEKAIADKYRDQQIIAAAQVSVQVLEARARTFSILGAVQAPGQYSILKNDFRLLDALVAARDLTTNSDLRLSRGFKYVYILRKVSEDEKVVSESGAVPLVPIEPATKPNTDVLTPRTDRGNQRSVVRLMDDPPATEPSATTPPTGDVEGRYVIIDGKPVLVTGPEPSTVPADGGIADMAAPSTTPFEFNQLIEPTDRRVIKVPLGLLKAGELKYNVVIRPEDVIIARPPVEGEYYMGGHVARVGVYSLTAREITLKQAVISAGMLDALAVPARTTIVRRIPGEDKEIFARVDLEKIFAGEEPDVYLKPDDQIMVGTNFVMPFIAAVRGGFRVTYGFGFLYDRNYASDSNNEQ